MTAVRQIARAYAPTDDRPLASYLGLMAAYGTGLGTLAQVARRRGRHLPDRTSWSDLALIGVATHKVARLLSKDPVTSPLRAPFTKFSGQSGEAELSEEVRGTGPQKAIGELLTCPFCIGQWVAAGFAFGLVLSPRLTRFVAGIFAVTSASDFLQLAYDKAQR